MLGLPSRENCVFGYAGTMAGWGGVGAVVLQGVIVQVGKPAWSHRPLRMMGSFPELYVNPTDTQQKIKECATYMRSSGG